MRREPLFGRTRRDVAGTRGRRLAALLAWVVLLLPAVSVSAQDTPEMLAAMRAMLPPVPDEVPAREELTPELRAQLPVFRIDMHRWHEDPDQRFVLIDGRRVSEGDVAAQQLWLRQVRRDGVVLQFRDGFFFQPK